MQTRRWLFRSAALLSLGGLGFAAWRLINQRSRQTCIACARPIHAGSRTVAFVDGKRKTYCCPACALSEHQQARTPVRVQQLTSFLDGAPLSPSHAWLVRNSKVASCGHHETPAVNADKRPLQVHFDRCSPSLLAFPDRQSASRFAAANGGDVLPFAQFAVRYVR